MDIFQAVILGTIQGITEFFPISSSGHLILLPRVFGWLPHSLAFDAILHLGTGLAVLFYFWRDWLEMLRSFAADTRYALRVMRASGMGQIDFSQASRRLLFIAAASVPVGVAGLLFDDFVATHLRSPRIIAAALFAIAILMLLAEKVSLGKHTLSRHSEPGSESTNRILKRVQDDENYLVGIRFADALVIGFSQVLALIPGVSRSGITMTAGLFRGLSREEAAQFSFLLATPIVLGAGLWGLLSSSLLITDYWPLITGFSFSFLAGLLTIKFFLRLMRHWGLLPFAVYRIFLAILVFVVFL